MKTLIITLAALSLVGVICAEDNTTKDVPKDVPKTDRDNTAQNSRDKSGETLTPEDQSNAPEDIQLSAAIRRSLMKNDSLSTNAKNIKIITIQGAVTLRGTVNSEEEKNQIVATAQGIQGIKQLKNELEVKKN